MKTAQSWICFAVLTLTMSLVGSQMFVETVAAAHPELTEQEMYIACADCHRQTTPEVESQWHQSVHGIAMVKCYQCHGTFETFKLQLVKADCAVCHADMLEKNPTQECWDCHLPHTFKAKE